MDHLVILSKLEQEYLLAAIEAALRISEPRRLFLWAQGQLQALLPHQAMVCLRVGSGGEVLHAECLHGTVQDRATLARLDDPDTGLAARLAQQWRQGPLRPAIVEAVPDDSWHAMPRQGHALMLAQFGHELCAARHATGQDALFANVLMHGTGPVPGGGTVVALFGMPYRPGPRQGYFLELLLPHMHLALQRVVFSSTFSASASASAAGVALADGPAAPLRTLQPQLAASTARPVSVREVEILQWVRDGKSNDEVGQILGISGLTVKNHLQRIYKTLGVSNRAQAVARSIALRLLPAAGMRPPA